MNKQVDNSYILGRIGQQSKQIQKKTSNVAGKSFEDVLNKINSKEVTISKHASERMQARAMALSETEMNSVERAVDKAAQKGVKDAVIVIGDKLLVTSIQNKTIITAAHKNDMKEQIITKIDGAIFI